ncbi:unnamed protein product [Sphagnum jensenii]|uniref:Transmembrane protein n=1 Tax=Sphagnum jensenii TaxID=128206 RepID=A0ABP1B7P3_9BRYO
MANVELAARLHCSYKRATFVLCAGNLVVALYLLQSVVGPFYFQTSSSTSTSTSNELQQQVGTGDHTAVAEALQQEVIYSEEDLKRQEESNDLRRAVLPVRLMERIKEIEAQTEVEISKSQSASAARQRVALELAQRLRYLRFINSKSNPQQGLEEWSKKKLDGLKKQEHTKLKKDQANEEEEEELVKKTEMIGFNSHPPDHESNVFKFMNPDEKGESIAAKLVRKKRG